VLTGLECKPTKQVVEKLNPVCIDIDSDDDVIPVVENIVCDIIDTESDSDIEEIVYAKNNNVSVNPDVYFKLCSFIYIHTHTYTQFIS